VLTAVFLSLEKLPREPASPTGSAAGGAAAAHVARAKDDQVKLAVSRKLCGAVIGQKGQTIRDFMADSGATIRVQVRACGGNVFWLVWGVECDLV
jgi:RNA-binding protein Nova